MLDSCRQCHDDLRLVDDNGKLKFVCSSQCGYEEEWTGQEHESVL